ncbi:CC0125/CC1285 family lipoprotein [Alteromonas sp. H39]|uniref:CC0125/CC1285 family lipoprotein n=1 Tax=Alteromonas sp. H39 TaxID=3389876 RepID=UPI0039E1CD89
MSVLSRTLCASVVISALSILSACSTTSTLAPTPYQAAKSTKGYGFSSTQLSENEYRVMFKASEATPADLVQQYTVLRGAELAKQQGYGWLAVVKTDIERKSAVSKKVIKNEGTKGGVFPPEQQCTMSGCQEVAQPFYGTDGEIEVEEVSSKDVFYSVVIRMADSQQAIGDNALSVEQILEERPEEKQ